MGLLDFFKKKKRLTSSDALDDESYIKEIRHCSQEAWHQYDVLLAARGYGWKGMVDWASYMSKADLMNISTITYSSLPGSKEIATEKGYTFLQVKTVQIGKYNSYDSTNRFYLSLGFRNLKCFRHCGMTATHVKYMSWR